MLKKIKLKFRPTYHTANLIVIRNRIKLHKIRFLKNRIFVTIGRQIKLERFRTNCIIPFNRDQN